MIRSDVVTTQTQTLKKGCHIQKGEEKEKPATYTYKADALNSYRRRTEEHTTT